MSISEPSDMEQSQPPVVKLVDDIPPMLNEKNNSNKKRKGRRRRPQSQSQAQAAKSPSLNYISDDGSVKSSAFSLSSSDESSSSTSADSSPKRRPQRRRRRTNGRQQQQKRTDAEVQLSLEEQNNYVAMDCEMVGVGPNGYKSMVARVTIVGWNGNILLDEFVKPQQQVTDYRTFVSGIAASDLESATLTFEECREKVLEILEGKVLVGHALKNDFRSLSISHPWDLTRDTAKYEPFMQTRFDDGVLWPRKLKDLAKQKLHRDIQDPSKPHSAYEDAVTALDLYRKARRKWEKAMEYKINKTKEIENSQNKN